MIGFHLSTACGFTGTVNAETGTPDGKLLVRLADEHGEERWYLADDVAVT